MKHIILFSFLILIVSVPLFSENQIKYFRQIETKINNELILNSVGSNKSFSFQTESANQVFSLKYNLK